MNLLLATSTANEFTAGYISTRIHNWLRDYFKAASKATPVMGTAMLNIPNKFHQIF